jgi:hypothetical protein
VNNGRPLPWHDTPSCRQPFHSIGPDSPSAMDGVCGGPMVPVRDMANGYGGERGASIACAACGHGIVGTAEEVARAERSSAAFRMLERGEIHAARGCARCNGVLPIGRFRLCVSCVEKDNAERQGVLF